MEATDRMEWTPYVFDFGHQYAIIPEMKMPKNRIESMAKHDTMNISTKLVDLCSPALFLVRLCTTLFLWLIARNHEPALQMNISMHRTMNMCFWNEYSSTGSSSESGGKSIFCSI